MQDNDIREIRKKIGLSQSKLAKISGIKQSRLSSYELSKSVLTKDELRTIHNLLETLSDTDIKRIKKKKYTANSSTNINKILVPIRNYSKTDNNQQYISQLDELKRKFNSKLPLNAPTAISFFAGCGGLCYGIRAAGFEILATNELVEDYKNIYKLNFPSANFLENDIRNINKKSLEKYHNVDLMIGGPPCQGFSLAGKRDQMDERNTLFSHYLEIADVIKPKVILMENVRLLTSMKDHDGELVKNGILKTFSRHGYKAHFYILNAKAYGVPQHRERVIFIGIREDLGKPPSIPAPEFIEDESSLIPGKKFFTFGDAVSDLEYLESGESSSKDKYHFAVKHPDHVIRWLVNVPEGMSAHDNESEDMRPPSGYNTTYKRQIWNEPAATVGTNFSMISGCRNVHPIATRALSIREALRIQSFPDEFKLCGALGIIRTVIGNAVPPMLAYHLAEHIKKTYIL